MKILVFGLNFSPELTGVGKYTGEMARWLAQNKYKVRVVCSNPYYPHWKLAKDTKNWYYKSNEDDIEITRCPIYVPSRISNLSRIVHLISFSLSSFLPVLKNFFWKPDIIIQVAPTLLCSIQSLLLSKFTGARLVLHIQDFEIDAMFGLSTSRSYFFKKIVFSIERVLINSFDKISTISQGMVQRAIKKGIRAEKIIFFPNWSESVPHFKKNRDKAFFTELGIDANKKIVCYSGNIGEKQGLELVIEVAKELSLCREIHFLIVGEGLFKQELVKVAQNLNLSNITFCGVMPDEIFFELLACCDCHLVIQRKGVSDAVLPSKLANIFAIGGNAVITAEKNTTLGSLCETFEGIATLVDPECKEALQKGILQSLKMENPNLIAIDYAKKFLDKEAILKRFFTEALKL